MFTNLNSTIVRTVVGTTGMAFCAGLCLFGATAPAQAATVRSQAVSYADLDLGNAAGRATLDRRIHAAARAVCVADGSDFETRFAEFRCVNRAVSDAKAKAARVLPQSAAL